MKENNEVELSIKVKNDEDVKVTAFGDTVELLTCLSVLASTMNEKLNISKSTIKEVVEMGLSEEHEPEENEDKEKTEETGGSTDFDEFINELLKHLS